MGEKQFTSYDAGQQRAAVSAMTARLDAILTAKTSAEDKLRAFDALWDDSRHLDRVALREICFLKLLKVIP